MANPGNQTPPHIAMFPCSGMGHLLPFLRLAAMFQSRGCMVTIIAAHPSVSSAESDQLSVFLSMHPNIKRLDFQLLPHQKSNLINEDPFFKQMEAINSSVHLLHPLLSCLSPPLSAILADFPITHNAADLASKLSIDAYIFIPTSARFFTLMTWLPQLQAKTGLSENDCIEIPCLGQIYVSSIPRQMLDPNTFFSANIRSSVSALSKTKGLLINTFKELETEAIEALSSSDRIAPIFPVGPLESFQNNKLEEEEARNNNIPWLDEQEPDSVLFVSFGSRSALPIDQIRELGLGLELSGCKFLWVLKTSIVDKEDKTGAAQVLGEAFLARTERQGTIVKGWVNQEQILEHPSIGGFLSHCGWNSVVEAAKSGVPILAWPQLGDHRVNAEVVEKEGLGLWVREWGWPGDGLRLVSKQEIAQTIKGVMFGDKFRGRAKELRDKATQAREANGTSESLLRGLIESLKRN